VKLDPALFSEAAIPAETRSVNLAIVKMMTGMAEWWDIGAAKVREARRRGEGAFPAPAMSERARWIEIAGPAGPLKLRAVAPEKSRGAYVHIHGGGHVLGAADQQDRLLEHIADSTGLTALSVEYRLAPEHPFPEPLDDCVAVYRALLEQGIAPRDMVIAGDSAGGNLTMTTLIAARDAGLPRPAAAVCLSPATDLRLHDEEKWTTVPDDLLHPRAIKMFRESYIGSGDPEDPLMSPVLADLRGLPPLFLLAAEPEGLCEDVVRLARAAEQQGVDVRLHIEPRMWHVWTLNLPELPQAIATLQDIADFIGEHTRQPVTVI